MKRGLGGALHDLALIFAAIALAFLLVGLARAEEPMATVRVLECSAHLCIVVKEDFDGLIVSNNANVDRADKAEAEAKRLREIKGCAKLEVTEPPRNFVPKKERDS